jgi:3-hydroxyisobutyrate dehydrogenase-like beta-hydroxyacid dehydrogenase
MTDLPHLGFIGTGNMGRHMARHLIEAGYPLSLAERLAVSEADLHLACEMLGRGCKPETAAEILL